ncbi:hypothetical protein [Acetobacter sp. DsW_063]|uniref:hypothetical protein n=1 Tax=Acetobacter sp. DsW_063 TaxID=1514894 RepID=UPI000A371509|nr:hypothetical protein [Acetobacter sp. DsW_063]OUJ15115.1 hypothetical protein HK28_10355 [Acetobacter sp. DsW_063]
MRLSRSIHAATVSFGLLSGSLVVLAPGVAEALTAKECHADFTAARKAGTLNGQTYKDYKAGHCSATDAAATSAPASASAATEAPAAAPSQAPASATPSASTTGSKAVTSYSGNAVFPSAVSSKYSSLSAGKARMKTCLDQYHVNKTNGGNGGLVWIQKGGGYYSQCVKRLKGE